MKIQIVAIRDTQHNGYSQPAYVPTLGIAIRSFADEVNNPQSPMNKHPRDYDLYHLGEWDDETGQFTNNDLPRKIAEGRTEFERSEAK